MTNREAKIARQKCDVREKENRVREAKANLDLGHQRLKAEFEREYAKLKSEFERAQIDLEREQIYLREVEDNVVDASGDL